MTSATLANWRPFHRLRKIYLTLAPAEMSAAGLFQLHMRVSALSLLVTFFISPPLWIGTRDLFRISPILKIAEHVPESVNDFLFISTVIVLSFLILFPRYHRFALYPPLACFLWALQDELRFQPFVYMYCFVMLVLGLSSGPGKDTRLFDPIRFMTAGIYFWAGYYKINLPFIQGMFPWFVGNWFPPSMFTSALATITPFLEAAIGIFLLIPLSRTLGILFASTMLAVVLLSLGPTGHNYAPIVWPWNVYIDVLAATLFWHHKEPLLDKKTLMRIPNIIAILLFWFWPVFGIAGPTFMGSDPAFKLYCACTPNVFVQFDPAENLSFLPPSLSDKVHHGRLDAISITYELLGVAAETAQPGLKLYTTGLKGFCPHLEKPDSTRLIISMFDAPWTTKLTTYSMPLCTAPPESAK
ncbi:MAG: hypothetical protein PW788_01400 [Micavibrio sp.]|nr:hypothetical protein [Micavibrio sp.]